MSRLLLIIVIAVVIYLLLRSFRKQPLQQDKTIPAEDMVRCAHCGMHLPKGESIEAGGQFFCGTEHRDIHRK